MNNMKRNFELLKSYQNITVDDYNISNNYKLEKIKDSNEETILRNKNGKWQYVSSKSSERIVDEINIKYIDEAIIILGFGIGNHIREILRKYPNNKLLVLENDFELLKYSMTVQDLSDVISNDRLAIGLFKNSDDLTAIIMHYFGSDNYIHVKAINYTQNDEDIIKQFFTVIESYNNTMKSIVKENIQKSENILAFPSTTKEYCSEGLNISSEELELILNQIIILSDKGTQLLGKLMDYINGNLQIDIDNVVKQYNEIENNFDNNSVLSKVIELPVYRYINDILNDEYYRKTVNDDKKTMQIKELKKNTKIYMARKECAEKLLSNILT